MAIQGTLQMPEKQIVPVNRDAVHQLAYDYVVLKKKYLILLKLAHLVANDDKNAYQDVAELTLQKIGE